MTLDKKFYSPTELAEIFGVTRATIHTWIKNGRFPNFVKIGAAGHLAVPDVDVEAIRQEEADQLIAKLRRLGFQPSFA